MEKVFFLLLIFQLKHFIADYPLQNPYLLRKVLPQWQFVLPLAIHCLVHAIITLGIVMIINIELWWLSIIDFSCHFLFDRLKAGENFFGRFSPEHPIFWWSLGLDQMMHHFTHYYIIYRLVTWQ